MKKKTILITGTNGFLAKNLIIFLKQKNLNVISTSKDQKNNTFFLNFNKIENNISFLPKFDFLIHLAYVKKNTFLKEKKINFDSSKILFETAKNNKSKIIYISSQSASINSLSNYGKIKHSIEELAKKYNSTIIRPGLVYQKKSFDGIFGKIKKIIINYPIIIFPSGLNKKVYLCSIQKLLENIYKEIINNNEMSKFIRIDDREGYSIKDLLIKITKKNKKNTILLPLNYLFFFFFLKTLEILRLDINLKSDSLLSLKEKL